MIELSPDQESCFDTIMSWFSDAGDLLTMGGYAGCGKTTLISKLRNALSPTIRIAFCSYTGKAASVLRSKLQVIGIKRFPEDYIGTIHSLIYEPMIDDMGDIEGWSLKPVLDYDFLIVDEASMVTEELFTDLKSYDIPILAIGDHGQLPPIEGNLNLMKNPLLKLEKIHRFAEKDALIQISVLAREQGYIPYGTYGDYVHKVPKNHSMVNEYINQCGDFSNSAILCGFNNTRVDINKRIRSKLGFKGVIPRIGERIICLKNNKNAKHCPIYNGVIGTVHDCSNHHTYLELFAKIDGEEKSYKGKISPKVFGNSKPPMDEFIFENASEHTGKRKLYLDCFDFGYVLTVHKSQGSEWDNVMVIEQPCQYWSGKNWNRWLYTAVTRSKNRLLIVR
jgi:exodeoxyribonuclease-5